MTLHEPATLLTDYLLALLGMICGWKLARLANPPQRWWSRALRLMGAAAFIGGTHHGFGPLLGEIASAALWRATLLLISLTSAAMSLTLVQEFAPEPPRCAWSCLVWSKFACSALIGIVYPVFLVVIADYGLAMLALAAAALFSARAWRGPMFAAVAFSALAATVQQMQWGFSVHFDHNALYHVIQGTAVFLFYRAGLKLGTKDRGKQPQANVESRASL
jgi:hypothetical protein